MSERGSGHGSGHATGEATGAVIHDLGYRGYDGPRLTDAQVAWVLYVSGLRHCFGLGRSGRSKVLPMGLLGVMLLPALILVGVLVQAKDLLGLSEQIVPYSTYPLTVQLLVSVFVAAQAPVVFSRDLRFRTITLYLARPLPRATYVLVRWASLVTATFLVVAAPLLLLYVGGLLAELPAGRETGRFLGALVGAAVLSALLGGLGGLVSALTVRRGLAVAAVIVVLVMSYGVVTTVQGLALETGRYGLGEVAGVFSPFTLAHHLQVTLFDVAEATPTPPVGPKADVVTVLAALVGVAAPVLLLLARYRKVSG